MCHSDWSLPQKHDINPKGGGAFFFLSKSVKANIQKTGKGGANITVRLVQIVTKYLPKKGSVQDYKVELVLGTKTKAQLGILKHIGVYGSLSTKLLEL